MFKVTSTVRQDSCNEHSSIVQLVLNQPFTGRDTVGDLEKLKPYADRALLYTQSHDGYPSARVYIYFSNYYKRWIATTRPDYTECNNLLSLPIYYPISTLGTTTYYQPCPI